MLKRRERTTEEFNLSEHMANHIRRAMVWLKMGDTPPRTHYMSMFIIVILVASGATLAAMCFTGDTSIQVDGKAMPAPLMLMLGLVMLCPGLYCTFIMLCCWRRVRGYDWWMIPHFG